jgi:hypothetical protein
VSVYINSRAVSLSPRRIGAGPLTLLIANEAATRLSLTVTGRGPRGLALARSGPIEPGSNTTLAVDLKPGGYVLATAASGAIEAQLDNGDSIAPVGLLVGAPRASGDSALLSP